MPVELVIAPEAESDIAEAYDWYEGRRPGLGEEFLSSVDACLGDAAVLVNPENVFDIVRGIRDVVLDEPLRTAREVLEIYQKAAGRGD
jgi:hypothetical protein